MYIQCAEYVVMFTDIQPAHSSSYYNSVSGLIVKAYFQIE